MSTRDQSYKIAIFFFQSSDKPFVIDLGVLRSRIDKKLNIRFLLRTITIVIVNVKL